MKNSIIFNVHRKSRVFTINSEIEPSASIRISNVAIDRKIDTFYLGSNQVLYIPMNSKGVQVVACPYDLEEYVENLKSVCDILKIDLTVNYVDDKWFFKPFFKKAFFYLFFLRDIWCPIIILQMYKLPEET